MATLSNAQIDALLREAEERLQRSSTTSTPSALQPQDDLPRITEIIQAPKQNDKLAVRLPQKSDSVAKSKDTAGPGWFGLPKTDMTPQFKRDWQILRMRSVLDPKHQKKALKAEAPKYSQIGEIIAGPTDYFSARLTRKEKGKTLLDEAMRESNKDKLKSKYAGIQKNKSSGRKAFYRKLVQDRRRGK